MLAGRTAVVTGASGDIGRAIAEALAAEGADLVLVGRSAPRLENVARAVRRLGRRALVFATDLSDDAGQAVVADGIRDQCERVDILVHSAGRYVRGRLETTNPADFDIQYRANLRAAFVLTQRLLPMLIERQGDIVFINSTQGLTARAETGPFAATQHGLKALADSLREEVNARGVRVLSLFAGRTATVRQERILKTEGRPWRPEALIQPADIAGLVLAAVSLPRTAEVTAISVRPMRKYY